MPTKQPPQKPFEMPKPAKIPEIIEPLDPDELIIPDEDPDFIPEENPFENPPEEMPPPAEGP
jgi:hypothetical protein